MSNTGCIVQRSLSNSRMLLKGHAPHDVEFKRLCLDDPSTVVAILWPSDDALTPAQVVDLARSRRDSDRPAGRNSATDTAGLAESGHANASDVDAAPASSPSGAAVQRHEQGNLILVAVDANWPCARRMMRWYADVLGDRFVQMSLPSGDVFPPGQEESLLAPVRKYRPQDGSFEHRCAPELLLYRDTATH